MNQRCGGARVRACASGCVAVVALVLLSACSSGETQNAPAPYKLGMFQENGRTFAGIVVGDTLVVDLSRAGLNAPATVHELIARWDAPMADRLGVWLLAAWAGVGSYVWGFLMLNTKRRHYAG